MMHANNTRFGLFLALVIVLIPSIVFSQGVRIKCSVLDVGGPTKGTINGELNNVRYMVIHHAYKRDREILSKKLRECSGKIVTFLAVDKDYKGVIYRLPACFGRGLLLFDKNAGVNKRDMIEVIFP